MKREIRVGEGSVKRLHVAPLEALWERRPFDLRVFWLWAMTLGATMGAAYAKGLIEWVVEKQVTGLAW